MAANKSSTRTSKGKGTARANATKKVAGRERSTAKGRAGASAKQASQGRFPGETPLTGEDRPADRAGGKRRGQGVGGASKR